MSRRRIAYATAIAALMAGAILAAPTAAARFNPKPPAPKTLAVERAAYIAPVTDASVVFIRTDGGFGSGFYIGDGLIVTAAHVLDGRKSAYIKTEDGRVGVATPIAIDEERDVAVMRTDRRNILAAEVDCDAVAVGTPITSFGMPLGIEFVAAYGKIAKSTQKGEGLGREYYVTDMTTVMGQSGGPVFAGGKVIGVTSAVMTAALRSGKGYVPTLVGFGFVVPSSVVCEMVAGLEGEGV